MERPSVTLACIALAAVLITPACTSENKHSGAPPGMYSPERMSKITSYAKDIKSAVEVKMYKAEAYAGKSCTVRISLQRDGTLNSATVEGGDPDLCKAAAFAVTHAKIPPAPDEETWQVFKNAPMDFRP
ncbi:cell envelope integrity protein TolA [Salmonella enterica]|jgi:colicin import membrane protein|nr:cell envelope integrity protein TolA [Salmonella enterica]ECF8135440.1 cell envelope integrity protein TolA [Salmonella enterica]EGI1955514.1 cell envelope integrity protein TolA [Salmonella enterica]EMA3598541.1 cell envelope integrity protein TolA [Salmonella enterica]